MTIKPSGAFAIQGDTMQILYNSENFSIVQFDVALTATPAAASAPSVDSAGIAATVEPAPLTYGGFEIVDKFARKETFLHGAMAEVFKEAVQALIETRPSEEEIDDYLERFTSLMQQPVVMH